MRYSCRFPLKLAHQSTAVAVAIGAKRTLIARLCGTPWELNRRRHGNGARKTQHGFAIIPKSDKVQR
jgi:hypothetical protein